MMGLLLVVALVLAWPTFGISILAWIALAIFKANSGTEGGGGGAERTGGGLSKVTRARLDPVVESYLQRMVDSGTEELDVPSLYFKSACRYAQSHGGKLYDDMRDSIIFDKEINGQNYSILFFTGRTGSGTNITVTKRRRSIEIAEGEANAFVATASANNPPPSRVIPSWASQREKISEFSEEVIHSVIGTGIPISYAEAVFSTDEVVGMLVAHAASLEAIGSSFADQQEGASKLVEAMWERLSDDHKGRFIALG